MGVETSGGTRLEVAAASGRLLRCTGRVEDFPQGPSAGGRMEGFKLGLKLGLYFLLFTARPLELNKMPETELLKVARYQHQDRKKKAECITLVADLTRWVKQRRRARKGNHGGR